MARRRSPNRKSSNRPSVGRDLINPIANRLVARLSPLRVFTPLRPIVRALEDRREFHPLGRNRTARAIKRSDTQLVIRDPIGGLKFNRLAFKVGFKVPKRVAICVRRQERKEIMFASGAAGGKVRKPKRTTFSDVRC